MNLKTEQSSDGKEIFTNGMSASFLSTLPSSTSSKPKEAVPPSPPKEEEDDITVPVAAGTRCRRKGCNKEFVSDEDSRLGDGEGTICVYHPAPVRYLSVVSIF